MSTALDTTPRQGDAAAVTTHRQNTLTQGQKPAWTWIAVALGAAALAVGLEFLVKGEGFEIARAIVFFAIAFILGMYAVTRIVENRRKATDGLWRHLVWAAFLVALVPLVSVL